MTKRNTVPLLAMLALLVLVAAGCGETDINTNADTLACAYDNTDNGGERLVLQVAPSHHASRKNIDVVYIPTSNRFYYVSQNRALADPEAPEFYEGTAKGGVRIRVEGQIRFRFNQSNACDWYAKHGRRNEPLRFNGDQLYGWAKWLNRNFATTMAQVISSRSNAYDWPNLVYNYPSNADPATGQVSGDHIALPTQDVYGDELGKAFTERLRANLGGVYFCGINGADCPEITFQVSRITTQSADLMNSRAEVEAARQAKENATAKAKLEQSGQPDLLKAEQKKQALLKEQGETARLEALTQPDVQKCLLYANHGLDCDGHFKTTIVAGVGK